MKKSVESVLNELQLLKCLHSEFIINSVGAFQDREYIYLVMDLIYGGDLRYHLIKNTIFSEKDTSASFLIRIHLHLRHPRPRVPPQK